MNKLDELRVKERDKNENTGHDTTLPFFEMVRSACKKLRENKTYWVKQIPLEQYR